MSDQVADVKRKAKRPKSISPTQRSLKHLRELGFTAQVVERWNHFAKIRQDLFGIIDVLAMRPGIGILGVQATSDSNHAARMAKAKAEPRIREWIESGGRIEVWSWGLRGGRGERKLWTLRREEIRTIDL